MESKELMVIERGVALRSLNEMREFGAHALQAGAAAGFKNQHEVVIALQTGAELGLSPMQSINSLYIVNGRATLFGDGMKGLVMASGLCEDFKEWVEGAGENMVAHCEIKRRGIASPVRVHFSVADAKRAGLWGRGNIWKNYPQRMLQMRARGWACRDAFPDVVRGIYTTEEARDFSEVTDYEVLPPDPEPETPTPAPADPPMDLELQRQRKRWATLREARGLSNDYLAAQAKEFGVSLASATGEQMKALLDYIEQEPAPVPEAAAEAEGDF